LKGYAGYPGGAVASLPTAATEWGTDSRATDAKMGKQALSGFLDFFQQGWDYAI
jgi:hypothetical protein